MDPLLTLLQSAFGECPIIRQNMQASTANQSDVAAAIEARVRDEVEREQYRQFCEACRRDLDPREAEYSGLPTFSEWKQFHQQGENA